MREDLRSKRRAQIADATYELLEEKGYSGTSMLSIARKSRASNETLYAWYGDKVGLFKALIEQNSEEIRLLLEEAHTTPQQSFSQTLDMLGPMLLDLLLGNRAVALNRAAASDATGELGRTLAETGRARNLPLIGDVFEDARKKGEITFEHLEDALGTYIGLLVGDLQIRRAIGALKEPTPAENAKRAQRSTALFLRLYYPSN